MRRCFPLSYLRNTYFLSRLRVFGSGMAKPSLVSPPFGYDSWADKEEGWSLARFNTFPKQDAVTHLLVNLQSCCNLLDG